MCTRSPCILIAVLAVVLQLAAGAAPDAASTPDSVQTPKSFKRQVRRTLEARYLLYLPRGYRQSSKTTWPLMLFLHGAGERGTNLNRVAIHGPPKLVQHQTDFPCIVVSPQCPPGEHWQNDTLLALLDHIIAKYRVDPRRVYLTGLSMGGYGTWSLGLERPERFAALVPICGGGDPIGVLLADRRKLKAVRALPIWAFHGAKDQVVRVSESERMVELVRRAGGKPKLTVYPDAEHDAWTQTYANPELFTWLFQQKR